MSNLDKATWEAIVKWPEFTDQPTTFFGLDFALLSRPFLWDKVGRSVRFREDPSLFASFEQGFDLREHRLTNFWTDRDQGKRLLGPDAYHQRVERARNMRMHQNITDYFKQHLVYCPLPHGRLYSTMQRLADEASSVLLCIPDIYDANHFVSYPNNLMVSAQPLWRREAGAELAVLFNGMIEGLAAQNIRLSQNDQEHLKRQLLHCFTFTQNVQEELQRVRPKALLMYCDNHPPFNCYVLAAQQLGIPTFMVQHGLDCEHFVLDDAYADYIGVWGAARQRRYEQQSAVQPLAIEVLGNPEWDYRPIADRPMPDGEHWLWVTRPHSPHKCHSPSRQPIEGLEILQALLAVLKTSPGQKLIIKPHPGDYAERYRQVINETDIRDRVQVSEEDIDGLLKRASLVFTEDSTAGLDACFFGKALIHVHFAESEPVLPFVDFKAALPARDPKQLAASIQEWGGFKAEDRSAMYRGQQRFLHDFAGSCDGKAAVRMAAFLESSLDH